MKSYHFAFLLLVLAIVLVSVSCGAGAPPIVTVTVSPASVTVDQGSTTQFSAMVTGSSNTSVVWSIDPSTAGSITSSGLFTASNSAGSARVIATSRANPSNSGTAFATINSVSISLSQASFELVPGETHALTATVSGTINKNVLWSIQEGASGGSVTSEGVYTAPASLGTFHVSATSAADTTRVAIVTIAVNNPVVSISPHSVGLLPGGSRAFTADVTGSDDRVTWSVQEGAAGGFITNEGIYTAPAQLGEYHIAATSIAYPIAVGVAKVVVTQSGFTSAGDMSVIRFNHTATLLPDGNVLLAGGGSKEWVETKTAELFDYKTATFKSTGDMNVARRWHTATLLLDGKVLVTGGGTDICWDYLPFKSAEIYDPSTGTFSAIPDMNASRLMHTATLLANGKVLIAGGYTPETNLATAELYDPKTGTFTSTGSMTSGRSNHRAIQLPDGRVLITGGWSDNGTATKAEVYDPGTGTFTQISDFQRDSHTVTALANGTVLLAGGIVYPSSGPSQIFDEIQYFDSTTATFTVVAKLNNPRYYHTATALADGRVLFVGGYVPTSIGADPDAEIFDPVRLSSTPAGSMETGREGHTATLLPNGKVLITGGIDLNSAELFTLK